MNLREQFEAREKEVLSPHAALAANSRGRARPEEEHEYRTAYQRDRDRILHSKAFRRLKRKTQVFLAPEGDHYRTRLTHTLEVAQIARTCARALSLNEDLTEAIALGHDLGHTPFGHAGEAVLDEVFEPGFRHAEQSLRMVDKLETRPSGKGLNLTAEVRDGIVSHSSGKCILSGERLDSALPLECDIVSVADVIAYINHDIDDALRGGVITLEDLPQDALAATGVTSSARINTMVNALINGSQEGAIGIVPETRAAINALRDYLYAELYPCDAIRKQIERAKKLLREMYYFLLEHPTAESAAGDPEDSLEQRTVDFLAGMTDPFALDLYRKLFLPTAWGV